MEIQARLNEATVLFQFFKDGKLQYTHQAIASNKKEANKKLRKYIKEYAHVQEYGKTRVQWTD